MNDKKIIDILIVSEGDKHSLKIECNKHLKNGYVPFQYSTCGKGSYSVEYSLTMVKYEDVGELPPKPIVDAIPYQMCPNCGGTGKTIIYPSYKDASTGSKEIVEICDICKGTRMIPMFVNKSKIL